MKNSNTFIQSDVPGDMYIRAKSVVLNNPKDGIKSATFNLEKIINLINDESTSISANSIVSNMPQTQEEYIEKIPLIDLKGNVLGEMMRGEMLEKMMLFLNSEMIYTYNKINNIKTNASEEELAHE